jgi:hypothetical protein
MSDSIFDAFPLRAVAAVQEDNLPSGFAWYGKKGERLFEVATQLQYGDDVHIFSVRVSRRGRVIVKHMGIEKFEA